MFAARNATKTIPIVTVAGGDPAALGVVSSPATRGNALALKDAEIAARALRVELQLLEARRVTHFESAYAAMSTKRAGALLILGDVMFTTYRARLASLAVKGRLPAMYGDRDVVDEGGLTS